MTYSPELEATALGNGSQSQGCAVCWPDLERTHLALWQEAARHPDPEPDSVSEVGPPGVMSGGVSEVCVQHPLQGKDTL